MLTDQELTQFRKLVDAQNPRLAIVLSVLSEPNRCKIFRLLVRNNQTDLCVSDFAKILKITSSAASQHLKQLEMTGVIIKERNGQKVHFKPQTKAPLVAAITKAIIKYF